MLDPMKLLNLVLALLGSLAAFGSFEKMKWGVTRPCVIGATLLIALGLAGQWLSLVHEEWLQYVDTALYGGILALVIASQRNHTWFLERWANPVASAIVFGVGLVFVGGLLTGCAQIPQTPPQPQASPTEIPVHIYDNEGVQMRMLSGPCVDARSVVMILSGLPQFLEKFHAIDSVWPMRDGTRRPFAGCWAELSAKEAGAPGAVLVLVFEDGQVFVVSKAEFLKTRGQAGA